jgi:hypothetical protein
MGAYIQIKSEFDYPISRAAVPVTFLKIFSLKRRMFIRMQAVVPKECCRAGRN